MADNVPTTSKVCPECGISLDGIDKAAHSLTHWPEYLDPAKSGKDARKRQAMLLNGGVSKADFMRLHEG